MKKIILSGLFVALLGTLSAQTEQKKYKDLSTTPSNVEVKEVDGVSNFYVNGEKYEVRGVGMNYADGHDFEALKNAGGNSFRTWVTYDADEELAACEKYDFMLAMGIGIGKELYGFDYNDEAAVKKQFEKVKTIVRKYKNHPKLLCWVVGNEINLLFDDEGGLADVNPKAYQAMADIIDFIHEEDKNHPVTTTFAGVIEPHLETAMKYISKVDIVSVQVYGDLIDVEDRMKKTGIKKPYMITEFGPMGFWEMPKTPWDREIEEASGPKADGILKRIKKGLLNNKSGKCLGGFAFEWGQKHERTPTWYGMFHEDGKQTENIDNLTKLWTGKYPENRAPRVDSLLLDNRKATDSIYLKPNTKYSARIFASDPNGDPLSYKWEIAEEVVKRSLGGEKEQKPPRVKVEIIKDEYGEFVFVTPKKEGEYRILSYVHDDKNKAGNANIPFYVKE